MPLPEGFTVHLNMKPGLAHNMGVVTLAAQLLRVKYAGVLRTCEYESDQHNL
jgi:hypothetical protein